MKFYLVFILALLLSIFPLTVYADSRNWKDEENRIRALGQTLHVPDDPTSEGQLPDFTDQELLRRHQPRIYIGPEGTAPIDFYRDYLPFTSLKLRSDPKNVLEKSPTRERLKAQRLRSDIYLDYEGPSEISEPSSKGYARVYREHVNLLMDGKFTLRKFTFLRYNFVFLHAGLPARLPFYKELLAKIFGDAAYWQELSNRDGIYLVLDELEQVIAVILAQYDYHRTYLRYLDFELPADGKVSVYFSERSHQPYLLPEGDVPVQRYAVLDLRNIRYLLLGGKQPIFGGTDVIHSLKSGAREIEYALEFLPEYDPLYVAHFPLGEIVFIGKRIENVWRRGPVGMDFSTWPELSDIGNLMQFWYLKHGDAEQAAFMELHLKSASEVHFDTILLRNGARFGKDFSEVQTLKSS